MLTVGALCLIAGASQPLRAADPTAEELQAVRDQLQQAQDRKNELASENETLKARLLELQTQLRDGHEAVERGYGLRLRMDQMEAFIAADAEVAAKWNLAERVELLADPGMMEPADLFGTGWPFRSPRVTSLAAVLPTEHAAPATTPADTQPSRPATEQAVTEHAVTEQAGTEQTMTEEKTSLQPEPATAASTRPATTEPTTAPASQPAGSL